MIYKSGSLTLTITLILLVSSNQAQQNPFWNGIEELFEVQEIFSDERLPNVVVAKDGSVLSVWGWNNVRVRRSEDGGETWGPEINIRTGLNAGGTIVDENSGDILIFTEEHHPPAPLHVFRSRDHGKTWTEENVVIYPDKKGNIPSMCMNEHGITLQHGPHAGRLIRPARYYAGGNQISEYPNHYTNSIYSDDGGKTWHTSSSFPAIGTGEAAIEELSDGRIYYNSRRHYSDDGLNPRRRHIAWSEDGGVTWKELSVSEELPDGAQNRDYGLMGGLVRLPINDHDILLFSNIESTQGRHSGTVWASFDGGKTWPVKRLVDEGTFAYSSMAAGRKGTPSEGWIYLLYESSTSRNEEGQGHIARFNLDWVTEGRDWRDYLQE